MELKANYPKFGFGNFGLFCAFQALAVVLKNFTILYKHKKRAYFGGNY